MRLKSLSLPHLAYNQFARQVKNLQAHAMDASTTILSTNLPIPCYRYIYDGSYVDLRLALRYAVTRSYLGFYPVYVALPGAPYVQGLSQPTNNCEWRAGHVRDFRGAGMRQELREWEDRELYARIKDSAEEGTPLSDEDLDYALSRISAGYEGKPLVVRACYQAYRELSSPKLSQRPSERARKYYQKATDRLTLSS